MLNPILASSARRRMRTLRTPLIMTLYALLPLIFAAASVFGMSRDAVPITQMRQNVEQYIILIVLQFFLIVLVAPAMTAGSISGERERQTLELLLVTNTGSLRIVLGKLLESFAFLALVALSGLPMTCVVLTVAGLDLRLALFSFLFLLVCAFAAASVGLFASSLFKKTVTATVTAYLLIFAIGVGTLLPLFSVSAELYDMAYGTNAVPYRQLSVGELIALFPPLLFVNPGMGLYTLLREQTSILESTFYFSGGYLYYDVLVALGFRTFTYINMIVMMGLSAVLIGLSALFVRPKRNPIRRRGKKHEG